MPAACEQSVQKLKASRDCSYRNMPIYCSQARGLYRIRTSIWIVRRLSLIISRTEKNLQVDFLIYQNSHNIHSYKRSERYNAV